MMILSCLTLFSLSCGLPEPLPALQERGETGTLLYSSLVEGSWQVFERDMHSGVARCLTERAGDKRYPRRTREGVVYFHTVSQECHRLGGPEESEEDTELLREFWPLRDVTTSPTGPEFAFARIRTDILDAADLVVFNPETGDRRWLTRDAGIQYTPRFSPNGEELVFVSGNGWGTYEIETIRLDGSDRRALTQNGIHDFLPTWSPDGKQIAFVSDRSGDYEIWKMDRDGKNPMRLTRSPGLDTCPTWSPDGMSLAFTSRRSGVLEVWATDADGSNARVLVRSTEGCRDPIWLARPEGAAPVAEAVLENPAAGTGSVDQVALSRKELDPDAGDTIRLSFRAASAARVRIDLVDPVGSLVCSLGPRQVEEGPVEFTWDGRGQGGAALAPGCYRYVIHTTDAEGVRTVLDASRAPWGLEMRPQQFTFDKGSGELHWLMPKAGYVRLRVALDDFPLLTTLLDWEALPAGRQSFTFDTLNGEDASSIRQHPDLWVTLELLELPANVVMLRGDALETVTDRTAAPTYAPLQAGPSAHLALRKPLREALAPRISLEFPTSPGLDEEGRVRVSADAPVRVHLDPRDAPSLIDALFEVAIYVDYQFVFEDEESTTPMTFNLSQASLRHGPHLLTINVFSYDGRIGCVTQAVTIGDDR